MVWVRCSFMDAVLELLSAFDKNETTQSLALVWRSDNEYNVLDEWLLRNIMSEMDGKTLKVVMWLNREEAAKLVSMIRGGV